MPTKSKPVQASRQVKPAVKAATARKRAMKPALVTQAPAARTGTKQSQLIALLSSSSGTNIEQMTATTGWQSHTVRGTISGVLRKRLGLNVVCQTEGQQRTYRIVKAA